jgi:hypothetical protein
MTKLLDAIVYFDALEMFLEVGSVFIPLIVIGLVGDLEYGL